MEENNSFFRLNSNLFEIYCNIIHYNFKVMFLILFRVLYPRYMGRIRLRGGGGGREKKKIFAPLPPTLSIFIYPSFKLRGREQLPLKIWGGVAPPWIRPWVLTWLRQYVALPYLFIFRRRAPLQVTLSVFLSVLTSSWGYQIIH